MVEIHASPFHAQYVIRGRHGYTPSFIHTILPAPTHKYKAITVWGTSIPSVEMIGAERVPGDGRMGVLGRRLIDFHDLTHYRTLCLGSHPAVMRRYGGFQYSQS